MGELKKRMKEEILQGISYQKQFSDEEISELIDEKIMEQTEKEPMSLKERLLLQKELFDSFRRLDILQELVDNPSVTEIMVNGPGDVFVETGGRIRRWDKSFESKEQLTDLILQIVGRVNRIVNTSSPKMPCQKFVYGQIGHLFNEASRSTRRKQIVPA